ncbi:MAG TPA: lipoyl(octanoyl) transferase LipB, partial [Gemmatimonadaceae bacterium]|nr:lipoyl(octanoyl) transferase LipB [Gemmatimonadaceae bacterium]
SRGIPRLSLLEIKDLTPYAAALELQRELARDRISGEQANDILLLVEHPPVVTLGRKAQRGGDNSAMAEFLAARGVELFEVERGGDATFHGPGQLVGYPILNLEQHRKDLHWYLRTLEEVLIRALGWWGIEAERQKGLTGVWTQGRKIASIGVHARGWVTWHGFALNVANDLAYFDLIVPCGIQGVVMTSVERELGERGERAPSLAEARRDVVRAFIDVFGFAPDDVTADDVAADDVAADGAATGGVAGEGVALDDDATEPGLRTASHSRSAP